MSDSAQQQQQNKQKGGGGDQRLNEILNLLRQLLKTTKEGAEKGSQAVKDKAHERANDPERIDDHIAWFGAYALIGITGIFFFSNAIPYESLVKIIISGPGFLVRCYGPQTKS